MTRRVLGRTGLRLSAFGARLGPAGVAVSLARAGDRPNWCDIPAGVTDREWFHLDRLLCAAGPDGGRQDQANAGSEPMSGGWQRPPAPSPPGGVESAGPMQEPPPILLARLAPDQWDRRMRPAVDELLRRTDRSSVELLQLAPFDLERIKAGEPFRRLQELREARCVRFFSVWTGRLRDARWVIENTPAHAVTIDAPRSEDGWGELFQLAAEEGTGVIAGPVMAGGEVGEARRLLADTPLTAFTWPMELS